MSSASSGQSPQSYTEYRTPTHEQIARRAYAIWEEAGRPEGRSVEHWLAAERELLFPSGVDQELKHEVPQTPPPTAGTPQGPGPLGTKPATKPAPRADVMDRSSTEPPPAGGTGRPA